MQQSKLDLVDVHQVNNGTQLISQFQRNVFITAGTDLRTPRAPNFRIPPPQYKQYSYTIYML